MNSVEGKLLISIFPESKMDSKVTIASSRPLTISKMFIGKTPEQVLAIIPMMFNICGVAQSRAALSAMMQTLHCPIHPKLDCAREILLNIEIAKEHLLRIFLDWPKLLNIEYHNKELQYISRMNNNFCEAMFASRKAFTLNHTEFEAHKLEELIEGLEQFLALNVFSSSTQDWLSHNSETLTCWAELEETLAAKAINHVRQFQLTALNNLSCNHLPELKEELLLKRLDTENAQQFINQPDWSGKYYETTSLSRQQGHSLLNSLSEDSQNFLLLRWVARLVELAHVPQKLKELHSIIRQSDVAAKISLSETGLSQIESARGRLIHRVKIEDELISQYQILAPTEWNFHPKGILAQSLARLNTLDKNELNTMSHLLINAVDPCVGYDLKIH